MAENPPAVEETQVQSLGQKDPLEEEVATQSSILAWKIPWTEKPGRLQLMRLQRLSMCVRVHARTQKHTHTHTHTYTHTHRHAESESEGCSVMSDSL